MVVVHMLLLLKNNTVKVYTLTIDIIIFSILLCVKFKM